MELTNKALIFIIWALIILLCISLLYIMYYTSKVNRQKKKRKQIQEALVQGTNCCGQPKLDRMSSSNNLVNNFAKSEPTLKRSAPDEYIANRPSLEPPYQPKGASSFGYPNHSNTYFIMEDQNRASFPHPSQNSIKSTSHYIDNEMDSFHWTYSGQPKLDRMSSSHNSDDYFAKSDPTLKRSAPDEQIANRSSLKLPYRSKGDSSFGHPNHSNASFIMEDQNRVSSPEPRRNSIKSTSHYLENKRDPLYWYHRITSSNYGSKAYDKQNLVSDL